MKAATDTYQTRTARYALLDSANINDRSLLGSRDSELAVLILDDDTSLKDINGDGKPQPVRTFAHELRKQVWSKLFGITGNVRPAEELRKAIDTPAHPSTWKAMQAIANKNSSVYDSVFPYIPKNAVVMPDGQLVSASIWPTWRRGTTNDTAPPMPFSSSFWIFLRPIDATTLSKLRGFILSLPIHWTEKESNNIGYHTALVTENTIQSPSQEGRSFG